jgi:hypothetical protein
MNTQTPRTDAAEKWTFGDNRPGMSFECVKVEFAEGLERQLNALNADLDAAFLANKTYRKIEHENFALREALKKIADSIPVFHEGEFVFLHHDPDGNELGFERIQPEAIIQVVQEIAESALRESQPKQP